MRLVSWIRRSVEYKVGFGVAALLLLVVAEVAGTWLLVRQQAADALVVNIAGRERMLSQRMSKNALLTAQGDAAAQEGMLKAAALFDTSLQGLLDGDPALGLPPAPSAVRPTLAELRAKWLPFKAAIETLNTAAPQSAEFTAALAEVIATNEALLAQADVATTSFQKAAEKKTQQMLWFLYAMAAVSAVVFGWTVWLVRRTVRPLHQLAAVATRLAQGDVSQTVALHAPDEVGQLAEALRALIAYEQTMAIAADQIAAGDLSAQVRPQSERDALGQAFARMTAYLSDKARVAGRLAQGHIGFEFQALSPTDELGNAFARMMAYLRATATAAEHLAQGDLTAEVAAHSEADALNLAFGRMINYQRVMAHAAEQLAEGNLQVEIVPHSSRDALGVAFDTMLATLRRLITQLTVDARRLSRAAEQLTHAARQSGESTEAIAATMHEVSNGTGQQSESIERVSGALEQLSRAIEGVAKGAQEQAVAVGKSAEVTGEINAAIQRVASHAHDSARDAAAAAAVARRGADTVQTTIGGMEGIKAKVGLSALKVKEMGKRSEQIGMIVATIDSIASQTNLLSLNAAIEAARAGEHGKGFAVVADEVRKLAEKSAKATREIAELIRGIQHTVTEAVGSMDDGVREVEDGVARAHEAGEALEAILASAESVRGQVDEIVEAARNMETGANELVIAMDSVSAVVEENTAATEQMAASTGGLLNDIENIASVSEENSAAAETISASAQGLSAQAQDVLLGTEAITEMAQSLFEQTRRFRIQVAEAEEVEAQAITAIAWDPSMATGIAKIDEQHQVLITKLNELTVAMRDRQGQMQIESIMQFLGQYVKEHFGYEEECMDKYACPVAGANREAHAKFVETFTQLAARVKREGAKAELVIIVQRQLAEWLVRHIRKTDTQLEPCVKAKLGAAQVKRQREARSA